MSKIKFKLTSFTLTFRIIKLLDSTNGIVTLSTPSGKTNPDCPLLLKKEHRNKSTISSLPIKLKYKPYHLSVTGPIHTFVVQNLFHATDFRKRKVDAFISSS